MDDYSIVDLSIKDNLLEFINSLKVLDQVNFVSTTDNNINSYTYIFATKQNNIALFANKNPNVENKYKNIIVNLEKPLENNNGIVSIKKVGIIPMEAIEETLVEEEGIREDVEIQETELSIWDLEYSQEEYKQEIVNELNSIYENRKNGYSLELESQQLLDLIEKTRDIDVDGVPKKSIKKLDGEYRPQLKHILEYNFHGSNIYPIVLDTKKYYTRDPILLENLDEEEKSNEDSDDNEKRDIYKNYTFLEFNQEIKVLIELYKSYAKSKGSRQGFINYHQFLEYLYKGGSIKIINEDDEEETIAFEAINRPYLNEDREKHYNWYSLKLKNNTLVFRHCTPGSPFTINPRTPKETNQSVVSRLAEGPVVLLKDRLEQNFVNENRGRLGRIRVCNGTDSKGDNFYAGNSKTSDFHRSIRKPPENREIVEGENLIVIGLYIQSPVNSPKNVFSGTEMIDGETKFYPKIFNAGNTVLDDTGKFKIPNRDNIKVINSPEEMDWTTYEVNYDYMVFFNDKENRELNKNSYIDIVNSILPSIDTILSINKETLGQTTNFIDIQRILNFYCMDFREISYDMMKKYNIRGKLVNNLVLARNLSKYQHKKYLQTRENVTTFNKMFDDLISIKWSEETKIVKNIYQVPNDTLNKTIYSNIIKRSINYFSNENIDTLVSFIKNYLYLEIDLSQTDKKYYIEVIVSYIDGLVNYRFYSNEFYKHFITNGSLIYNNDPKFNLSELFDKFMKLYKINIYNFTRNYYGNMDTTVLKQIEFISKLNKTYNAGIEFYELILINNRINFKNIVETIIEDYAKKEYYSITNKDWSQATDDEKIEYYPNYNRLKEYNAEKSKLFDIFEDERKKYNVYNDKCANVKIKKIYNNKVDLTADDSKTIYVDSVFDSIEKDIALYKTVKKNNSNKSNEDIVTIFRNKLGIAYIFETEDEIKHRVDEVIEIVSSVSNTDKYRTKIKNGDMAILQSDSKRYLYRRISDYWVPIDKASYAGLTKCYLGDNKEFLRHDYKELESICNKECVYEHNKNIHKKAMAFFKHMEFITMRIFNLTSVLMYKENIDTEIYDKIGSLNRLYDYLTYTVDKEKRLREKVPILEKSKLVYPPKSILDRLNTIRSINDIDLMSNELSKFIENYGIPYNRNAEENNPENRETTSGYYYYDFPLVNVPIVCKHIVELGEAAYRDNTAKANKLNDVKRKWGIANAAYVSCKNCGEIIDYAKLSEFEGFGKNDKAIRVREKVEDTIDTDIEEELELSRLDAVLTSEQQKVKSIVDSISKIVNIHMKAKDIMFIVNKTLEYNSNVYSFGIFYTAILPGIKNEAIKKYIENQKYLVEEKQFREDKGTIEDNTISSLLESNKYKNLTQFIFGKSTDSNNPKGPGYQLYKSYVSYNLVLSTVSFMIHSIINSIPDYYVKGSSIERKTKGQLIKDMFINPDQTILYFSKNLFNLFKLNPKEANHFTNSNQYIKEFYGNNIDSELTRLLKEEFFDKFSNHQDIIESYNKKKDYRTELLLNEKTKEINKKYDWNEFLPELKFKDTFVYEETNADNLIDNYNNLYSKIGEVNKRISTAIGKVSEEDISIQRSLADDLVSTLDSIKLIYNKLSYKYISTINDIVFEEDPGNTNPSYYTNIIAHYKTGSKYNEYFKQKLRENGLFGLEDIITILERSLNKIYKFLQSNEISGIKNNIQFLTHSTPARDLQYYMYFDRATSNDLGMVRKKLVDKLKLTNTIINLNRGPLYGTRRMFRELHDNDYSIVIETVSEIIKLSSVPVDDQEELPISTEELKSKVKAKLFEKYGPSIEEHIELKLRILFKYNGKVIIDLLSGEIKKEIEDKIEEETKGMSIEELRNKLSTIQIESDKKNIIYKNPFGMLESLEEPTPKKLIYSQIYNIVKSFISIFDPEDPSIEELVGKLTDIQLDAENSSNIDEGQILNKVSDNLGEYYNFNRNRLDNISKIFSNITKFKVETVKNKLDNIGKITNVIKEIVTDIPNSLKIEGIYENSNLEKLFREQRLEQVGYSYEIYNHTVIIRFLLEIVSKINYKKQIEEFAKSFSKGSDISIINMMAEANRDIFNRILEIVTNDDTLDSTVNISIENVEKFISQVVSLESTISPDGNISYCYVSHPKIIRVFTKNIIFYLVDNIYKFVEEISKSVDDSNYLVEQVIKLIYNFIDRQDKFTNVTDNDVAEIIKLRKADENIARKEKFKKLSKEDQDTQRIYRQFYLGKKYVDDSGLEIAIDDNRDEQGDNVDRDAEAIANYMNEHGGNGQEAQDALEAALAANRDEESEPLIRGQNDDDDVDSDFEDDQNDYYGYGRIDDF